MDLRGYSKLYTIGLLALSFTIAHKSFSQRYFNSDSLLAVYNSSVHDSSRIQSIILLGWNLSESDPVKSAECAKTGLNGARELKDKMLIAEAYSLMANNYFLKEDFVNVAKFYLLALEQYEKVPSKMGMAKVYNNLGVLSEKQGKLKEAIKYFEQALNLRKENGEQWQHNMLSNIGVIYVRLEKYAEAEANLKEALRIESKYGYIKAAAQSIQNLGNLSMNTGRYGKADSLFNRAYYLLDSLGDKPASRNCLLAISSMYNQLSKHQLAAGYALRARSMIQNEEALSDLEIIYTALRDYERARGACEKSLLYTDSLLEVTEKLYSSELAMQTTEMAEKYHSEKVEKENIILKNEKETIENLAHNRKVLLLLLLIVGILLIGITFLYLRHKKLKTQRHTIELKQQALRAQVNPHFIFNALNAIQRLYLENKKELADEYLGDFGQLLRKILENSETSTLSLHEEIETLRLYLNLERNRAEGSFDYEIKGLEELDALHIFIPALILQPIVENAVWHGLSGIKNGKIKICILNQANHLLKVSIEDNGVGISNNTEKLHESRGIKLVEERLKPSGRLIIRSEEGKGTVVELVISYKIIS